MATNQQVTLDAEYQMAIDDACALWIYPQEAEPYRGNQKLAEAIDVLIAKKEKVSAVKLAELVKAVCPAKEKQPSKELYNELFIILIPLIRSTLRKLNISAKNNPDLTLSVLLGIHAALESFDPTRGMHIYSYTSQYLHYSLLNFLNRDYHLISLPAYQTKEKSNLHLISIDKKLKFGNKAVSLADSLMDPDESPSQQLEYKELRALFQDIIHTMDSRTIDMLVDRIGGLTLEAIGQKHNLTRERVRQICRQSLLYIRTQMEKLGIPFNAPASVKWYT